MEGDVAADLLAAHAVDKVSQAVGTGVQVGVVDLVGITGEDNASVDACAGNDGFDFVWGRVLRFIYD